MKQSSVLTSFRRKSSFAVIAMVVALLFPVLTSPVAFAFGSGSGNPFGNGTQFSTEGTFQNTIRGVNLSGVASFSTGDTAAASVSSGTFTVSYQGTSYTGNVDGSIDPAAGTIAAAMEASVTRQGSGTAINLVSSEYLLTGDSTTTTPATTISGGTAVTMQTTTVTVDNTADVPPGGITTTTTTAPVTIDLPDTFSGGTVVTTPIYAWVDEIATSNYQDTSYASGSFTAKLQNSWPNQIFKGNGKMAFTSINFDLNPPVLVTTNVNISVKGSRISNAAQTFTAQTVQVPSVITTTELVNRGGTTN
ncbi:MAG: hypothetical protein ACOYM3_03370 [Terrimicrobiaceae bacterium]